MSNRSLRWVLDLFVVVAWTVAAFAGAYFGLDGPLRVVAFLPVVTFLPGYAVVSLVYPRRPADDVASFDDRDRSLSRAYAATGRLPGPERVGLSALLSVVVVPAVVVVVNFSPWPISLGPVLVGVVAVTLAAAVLAFVARTRTAPEERYAPPFPTPSTLGFGGPGRRRSGTAVWTATLVLSLVLLASSVGYALVAPPQSPGYTELYVQSGDVDGQTETLYPSTYVQGEREKLTFAIANHEHQRTDYGYVVLLQRVDGQGDGATVREQTRVDGGRVTVPDGETRNVTVGVTPDEVGSDRRLVVLVYEGAPPSNPSLDDAYRSLRLPIDVLASGDAGNGDVRTPGSDETGR